MILQSLLDLYERLARDPAYRIAPPGFSTQKIAFRVVLHPDGSLFEIQDMRIGEGKKLYPRQMLMPGGTKPSGPGINPCFLWDNTAYLLGHVPHDPKIPEEELQKKQARALKCFEQFRQKHLDLESDIGSPAFSAVCRFLERWQPDRAEDHDVLKEGTAGFGVFQLLGEDQYVHQDDAVTRWWDEQAGGKRDGETGYCLLSGKRTSLARLHEPKIKGVRVAQPPPGGATIVGFNEDAYCSYGKKKSFNAPVSADAAFKYATALNSLLTGPKRDKHRLDLGDMTVAFWTDRPSPTEDIFAAFASSGSTLVESVDVQDEAQRQRLEAFLAALRQGKEAYGELEDDPAGTGFFLLGLSPNAARIAVRFFHRSTLAELLENLRLHHEHIRVDRQPPTGKYRGDPEFPPMWLLLAQTARERKEIPPILAGPLLRAIISGTRYPNGLFQAVLRRIHADREINYARACVLKGYLTRNLGKEISVSLDRERSDPSYRLGRLFAALEKTQLDALGKGINATIRDRFYSAASATPGSVFPRLLRTYQHHLAKLDGGLKVHREKLVQEILGPLENFPKHLDLSAQGLFALGYYHQSRDFYTSKGEPTDGASPMEEGSGA